MRRLPVFVLAGFITLGAAPAPDPLAQRRGLEAAVEAGEHVRVVELADELARHQPDDAGLWYALGRSAFALKRYEVAAEASERAWNLGHRWMPWIALRIARSHAALENDTATYAWLEKALARGFEDRQSLAGYEELERFRNQPRFRALAGLQAPDSRAEGLAADVEFLVAEAKRLHPEYPDRAADFEAAAAELKRRAPGTSDRDFLFETMRLVALLGDGHSYLMGPGEGSPLEVPGGSLPLLFYLFEDGLHVVDGSGRGEALIGRRVVRIGRRTPEELVAHSRILHGSDNPMTMRWLGVHFYFPRAGFLLDAGAIDDQARVPLTLERDSGGTETVVLATGDHGFPRKLRPPKMEDVEAPRYLQRVDTNYWLELLADDRILYFQLNQVRDTEGEPLADFAERLGSVLQRPSVEHLVIDLRHNNGGNNGLLRPLVRQIVAFDSRPVSQVWVITGRGTFSAAQNFANRLERWTDALFVGEPSSSSPNFVGEETGVVLPWSRLQGSISSRYWQDSDPGDERAWIAPHLPVPPRAENYFRGRDAALEAVLEAIGDRESSARSSTSLQEFHTHLAVAAP